MEGGCSSEESERIVGMLLVRLSELRTKILAESIQIVEDSTEAAESIFAICGALDSLQSPLATFQALQQQQQFEREVAIGDIEYSRNVLLNKLQQYTGTEHFDVIKEATAFASSIKVLQHNNDSDLLLLPPYLNPNHAAPSHSLIIFDNTNPRLSRNLPTQDDFNEIDQTGRHASNSSPLDSLKWFMIAAAKVILPVVGVVAVLSLPGYQPRHMTEKMIGSLCPPGKVAVVEAGKVRCIVKERVEIPFTSVASNADATYGCG
ncbi:Plastid division protein PDV2-like protein [Drosera capensis]